MDRKTDRPYDVILYGASGFVGKQTIAYFAQQAPQQVRWAIAGRNRQKLEAAKAEIGSIPDDVAILVADSRDQQAVDAMVAQTRVLLSTAGPFALYGTATVDACVRYKTDYVDITGETVWARSLIDRYHEQAAADGTRIIPFCGFDSVPSDLGTYLVVRYMQQVYNSACAGVKAYFQAYGGLNGGTLASGFNLYDSGQARQAADPFLLNPPGKHDAAEIEQNQDPTLPEYDAEIGTWVAPFVMGFVNTRVVRRSSALYAAWQQPYGPHFSYQEYLKFDPPLDWLQAAGVTAGMAVAMTALQSPPIRQVLRPWLPEPGKGPSEQTMNEGWFRCELIGRSTDDRLVRGVIYNQGDPGNRSTVKFLCESALALVLNLDDLPQGEATGGVLTPATGLGDALVNRLRQADVKIEVGRA